MSDGQSTAQQIPARETKIDAGEWLSSATHILGAVLAVAGTVALITLAIPYGEPRRIMVLSVFGATLIVLYLASALYHSLRGRAKQVFHVLDLCAIYILIAGTYTPLTLMRMKGAWGVRLFVIVWTLAAIGVFKDALFHKRLRWVSFVLYLLMGWLVVFAFVPLVQALPPDGIAWLLAGGVFYTGGLSFMALERRFSYMHGAWHLTVLGGSACHYILILRYVALAPVS